MSQPVRLRRAAQTEYDNAADWYEARKVGLGLRVVDAVRQVVDEIPAQPDRYPEAIPVSARRL
jgi:plasmid stabilization system protein ParE